MADDSTNYDVSVLKISPSGMNTVAGNLHDLGQAVSDSLVTINNTLSGLRVAWQGKAASDADDLNKEWVRVMTELFGTKDDPSKGVLPTLADGVGMVSANFSAAEDGITDLFKNFTNTSGSNDKPEAVTDTNKTAVTMTFPG
ncbi:WXG100 family type VII secretion target [Actinacidiphila alni]|uniref:WXG100 family type VII secretion target n=1 Tax=Actinacidiphila alni TaxID=380248 RepID=UPI0034560F95